ncbi:hypothetical protein HBB16_12295 [Pseudonocardia sp. MCCB 268]|nr:hypothetical protein [Pseudonocardia cytotoxica]
MTSARATSAARLPHNRLFSLAIVAAGLSLVVVAVAVHLFAQRRRGDARRRVRRDRVPHRADDHRNPGHDDRIRGRINAFVRSLWCGWCCSGRCRWCRSWWVSSPPGRSPSVTYPFVVDGTQFRPGRRAGSVAAVVGTIAYRQMDERGLRPLVRTWSRPCAQASGGPECGRAE